MPAQQHVLELHHAFNGQPSFNTCGTRQRGGWPSGFSPTDPEIKLKADPDIQSEEHGLNGEAQLL